MPILELEHVGKTYRVSDEVEVPALEDVSLSFCSGEFAALMGPSGSGKSTLLNVLGCLDQPTRGRYVLAGEDVAEFSRDRLAEVRNCRIGFVFQGFNLLSRTSALENIELPLMYNREGLGLRAIQARAHEALELVGLADRADHYPSQLSGGQQQRIAIARALVNRPTVLLADEPTGNLDTRTGLEIMGVFQRLNEQGILLIMVTHEPDIGRFAKRLIRMRDGRVISDEPTHGRLDARREQATLTAATEGKEEP